MKVLMGLQAINMFLNNYNDRDKLLRLLQYSLQLVSGIKKSEALSNVINLINECRTTLRLFDDIPMLMHSLSYGFGKNVSM